MEASRLVTRSQLARYAGVSPAAVTKACKNKLAAAAVGRRIDLDHDSVREWLVDKECDPTKLQIGPAKRRPVARKGAPNRRKKTAKAAPEPEVVESPDDAEELLDWTFRDIVDRLGNLPGFSEWLDARKKVGDIRRLEIQNAEAQAKVIDRELVRTHIIGAMDAANRRLLLDASKTIARRLYGAARSGVPLEEAEKTVRDVISSQLKPLKATAVRVLRQEGQ